MFYLIRTTAENQNVHKLTMCRLSIARLGDHMKHISQMYSFDELKTIQNNSAFNTHTRTHNCGIMRNPMCQHANVVDLDLRPPPNG